MSSFERVSPTEAEDIREVTESILTLQSRFASQEGRLMERGTHAKGVCARAVFEVLDVADIYDGHMAKRLGRGIFAQPGSYPAVVRFASAETRVQTDAKPDVRALSFSIELPAADPGGEPGRADFSLNAATTFPINDVHQFAVFIRVLAAAGGLKALRTFMVMPWRDKLGVLGVIVRGIKQKKRARVGWQQMRYWSCVPFTHGDDEVIKYSATPSPANPGQPLNGGASMLRDELWRHLTEDARMASFDFALQFLDTDRMRYRGKRRDPEFWVENAMIEWNEEEAPFHVVARLTLLPASQLSAAETEQQYIDVVAHAPPGNRPIGSLNRGRWQTESASRARRYAQHRALGSGGERRAAPPAAAPPAAAPLRLLRRAGAVPVGRVGRTGALAAGLAIAAIGVLSAGTVAYVHSDRTVLPSQTVDRVVYADQGWGEGLESDPRQTYYYTPQGAGLRGVRYSWFVHLEMPWGRARFADPEQLRRFGFLVDPPTSRNPDRLPVGFTRHFDRTMNEEMLSISCAACHTGELHLTQNGYTTAVRIDGGQALHAFTDASFGNFLPTMLTAMVSTVANPLKFNRFARRVLGDDYPVGRGELRSQMREVIGTLSAIAWHERKLYPTQEGYGRTDALARIANTVFGENLNLDNLDIGNAPVSYPPLWNIWKFDWVQYNASVSQPMARNVGEALGVGAQYSLVDRYGRPLPPGDRFRSSVLVDSLHVIEETLQRLKPPAWPEAVFGAVDRDLAAEGGRLFRQHCAGCHGPHEASPALKARNAPLKRADQPEWVMKTICVDDVGTDPAAAVNFSRATVDITRTGLTGDDLRRIAARNLAGFQERQYAYFNTLIDNVDDEIARTTPGGEARRDSLRSQRAGLATQRDGIAADTRRSLSGIDPQRLPVGLGLSFIGTMIRDRAYEDRGFPADLRETMDGFGIADRPQILAAYKPRPLAGIWATPPFLHNGSVPTIYHLLSPVAERPTTFAVGSREFDTQHLGLAKPQSGRWFTLDTSLPGNSNRGHEFREGYVEWRPGAPSQQGVIGPLLTHDERMAIIEHLKIRDDDAEAVLLPDPAEWADCPVPAAPLTSRARRR
jgi:mono/diheme cytochrome c family protein